MPLGNFSLREDVDLVCRRAFTQDSFRTSVRYSPVVYCSKTSALRCRRPERKVHYASPLQPSEHHPVRDEATHGSTRYRDYAGPGAHTVQRQPVPSAANNPVLQS